jgi:hypothetical protein
MMDMNEPMYPEPVIDAGYFNPTEAEVLRYQSQQEYKVFGDTPAAETKTIPENVSLWDLWKKVAKSEPFLWNQGSYGTCVSQAGAAAVMYLSASEVMAGEAEEVKSLSTEVVYGFSRVEIANNRIPCRSDGSNGIWCVEGLKKFGICERKNYGSYDLSKYSGETSRTFGCTGVPQNIEDECAKHKIGFYSQVKTVEDLGLALANGYPVIVCSNRGFSRNLDERGVAAPYSVWQHAMLLCSKQGDLYGCQNSWGDYFRCANKPDYLPNLGCFMIDKKTVAGMLAQGDSWAISNFNGFKKRNIDWSF